MSDNRFLIEGLPTIKSEHRADLLKFRCGAFAIVEWTDT